jgi:uncharacterized protein YdcH (DUF465 family)
MNITLRKASALQNSINEAIRNIKITTTIEINEFQDPVATLQTANTTLFENDARRQKLLLALYNIRGLVGTANASSGIDLKLATAAFVDKRISQLEDFSSLSPLLEETVLVGKLEKIKNRKEESRASLYGRDDTVSTSVVSQEQINMAKAEIQNLKKQKQKINDEILELNIKTEIPLSDDVNELLKTEGLL